MEDSVLTFRNFYPPLDKWEIKAPTENGRESKHGGLEREENSSNTSLDNQKKEQVSQRNVVGLQAAPESHLRLLSMMLGQVDLYDRVVFSSSTQRFQVSKWPGRGRQLDSRDTFQVLSGR